MQPCSATVVTAAVTVVTVIIPIEEEGNSTIVKVENVLQGHPVKI